MRRPKTEVITLEEDGSYRKADDNIKSAILLSDILNVLYSQAGHNNMEGIVAHNGNKIKGNKLKNSFRY